MGTFARYAVVVAVALGAVSGNTSWAWAQSTADAKCHSSIARDVTRYQGVLMKTLSGCHKARSGGDEPLATDCNAVTTADLNGKIPNAVARLTNSILESCENASPAVLALYPRCPSPAAAVDDGGATTGIDDFAELAGCMTALSDAYAGQIAGEILGSPAAVLSPAHQRCQGSIAKAAARVLRAAARARTSCQRKQEKSLGGLVFDACAGAAGDADGRIVAALENLDGRVAADCDFDDGHAIGACGFDAGSLQECVRHRVVAPLANGLVAAAEQLPGTCPSFAGFVVNAGSGPKQTATRVDLGYRGYGHRMDVVDGAHGGVRLSGCDENCENCQISLDTEDGSCRCDSDATVECSTIAGPDPACGGGLCRCTLGPPLPQSAGSLPLCLLESFAAELDGSSGAAGEYEVDVRLESRVHTGISQTQPCPVCEGDAIADDGVRDGVCQGGARNGMPCDGNGAHPMFGAVSLDCRPSPGAHLPSSGLRRMTFGSGPHSLTAAIADPAQCNGGTCHCSVCSGDSTVGCSANADCAILGAGTCGVALANNPQENTCSGGASHCADDGNGNGVCDAGPVDLFCDEFAEGNGRGILGCIVNADCDANDCNADGVATPGECGTCSLENPRSCFLPTVEANGTAGLFSGEGAAAFCVSRAPTLIFDLLNVPGYPGPGRVKLDMDFDLYCADRSTRFELPGGSNCP